MRAAPVAQSFAVLSLGVCFFSSAARAQEVPSGAPPATSLEVPPPTPAPSPETPEKDPSDVRFRDANADRVVLGSTAETHPAGTFFFSDYELVLLQFGYAVTDDVQLSLTGVPPLVKDQPYWFELGAKINLVRTRSFRAAVTGGLEVVTAGSGTDAGPYYGGRFGAVGQFCFDQPCRSSLSLNGGTLVTSGIDRALPFYGSAGLIANLSPVVSLLAEPAFVGIAGTGTSDVSGGGLFAFDYGVRFSGRNFGVDVTFLEPLASTTGSFDNPFILGYPFLAFTYRTDGTRAAERSALAGRP